MTDMGKDSLFSLANTMGSNTTACDLINYDAL